MYLFFNSAFHPVSTPLFTAGNRAYRYGEGLFETMVYLNGRICFLNDHFERLKKGMDAIGFKTPEYFTVPFIENPVAELVKINGHIPAARIRLSVTAGNGLLGSFSPDGFDLLIESFPLEQLPGTLNEHGWRTGLFNTVRKSADALSSFKTASHIVYAMSARFAANHKLNDCLVLNTNGEICDTSIASIFLVKNNEIVTPPLSSGCIDGVLRKKLVKKLQEEGYAIAERTVMPLELEQADELFVTNVVQGIRWIEQYNEKIYQKKLVRLIADDMLPALYLY